jgi:hypothetical protein
MTITEALDYVKNILNETAAEQPNWTDAELYKLFEAKSNEAVTVLGLIEGKDTATTVVSGTADYNYPSNFLRIRRVRYDGIPLKYLDFRRFETRTPSGVAPTGTPREFTLWNNVITLIPTPSFSSGTPVLTIYGDKYQSSITGTSSTLDIPAVFHPALCDAVLAEMFSKDLNAAFSQRYEQKWQQVHKPAMREFAKQRRRTGQSITVIDADSNLETEFGVV